MKTKIVSMVIMAALASACATIGEPTHAVLASVAGEPGDRNFQRRIAWIPGPDQGEGSFSDFPAPVVWVRFGVTKEAAAQEIADALVARKTAESAVTLPR